MNLCNPALKSASELFLKAVTVSSIYSVNSVPGWVCLSSVTNFSKVATIFSFVLIIDHHLYCNFYLHLEEYAYIKLNATKKTAKFGLFSNKFHYLDSGYSIGL